MAQRYGFTIRGAKVTSRECALTLARAASTRRMASAYATSPRGVYCKPMRSKFGAAPARKQQIQPQCTARSVRVRTTVHVVAARVIDGPNSHRTQGESIGRPAAGRTGRRTPDRRVVRRLHAGLRGAVWMGTDQARVASVAHIHGVKVCTADVPRVDVEAVMLAAHQGLPSETPAATGIGVLRDPVPVPDLTGLIPKSRPNTLQDLGIDRGRRTRAGSRPRPILAGLVGSRRPRRARRREGVDGRAVPVERRRRVRRPRRLRR